jgi:hypothetical protein
MGEYTATDSRPLTQLSKPQGQRMVKLPNSPNLKAANGEPAGRERHREGEHGHGPTADHMLSQHHVPLCFEGRWIAKLLLLYIENNDDRTVESIMNGGWNNSSQEGELVVRGDRFDIDPT